jgi:transglutaminase-like putative cysteine protease
MRYDIRLTIAHRYDQPADHLRTLVRVLPRDLAGRQIVATRRLEVAPLPSERRDGADFFGNATVSLAFHAPVAALDLTLLAQVERLAMPPRLDLSPDLAGLRRELAAQRGLGPEAPLHFLGASPRIPDAADPEEDAIAAYAAARVAEAGARTAMEAVTALGRALHADMRFDAGATDVDTPPAEAFAARHGVCQDFSHVMIAGLRSLGVPAAYVSGFLRTVPPPGQPRLEGADAMHAWVAAWGGSEMGWIDYDPTNACLVGVDHITVAYGRDYGDVAPVKGALRSGGGQSSTQAVDVIPL